MTSANQPQRIGLFGGSFDPVHNAHVALAEVAMAQLQLDSVRWTPVGNPWQKPSQLAPVEHRAAMVALAIAHEPRFVLDRTELDHHGPSYTLDTVRELQASHPGAQWFLIIGQDQYANFHTWRGWRELLQAVTLAVAGRPGASAEVNAEVLTEVATTGHQPVALPVMDISSTEIRSCIASGRGIADLVPPSVASYIARHSLYRGPHTHIHTHTPHRQELNGHS